MTGERMEMRQEPSASKQRREPEPFLASFAADFDRHFIYCDGSGWIVKARVYLTTHSLWVLLGYRFGRSLKARPVPLFNPILWGIFRLWEFTARAATGITLDVDARIAPGLLIGHFGAIFIGPGVTIGKDCSVGHTCVLSGDGAWPDTPAPVIGERVYLAPGTKVIGPVTVGDDAALGANSVVVEDIPPSATAVGNPATVINDKGSAKYLRLRAG